MKRFLFFLLFVVLSVRLVTKADTKIEQDGLIFTVLSETDYTCAVSASLDLRGNVRIPSNVNLYGADYKVVAVEQSGFKGAQVDSVYFPNSLRTISDYAFMSSTVKHIDLCEVNYIGKMAFRSSKLQSIVLPEFISNMSSEVFAGCSDLEKVKIEANMTYLPSNLFTDCPSLKEVEIIRDLISIGNGCFNKCTNLQEIELPSTLSSMGHGTFRDCKSLKSINIPSQVSEIGSWTFSGCLSIEKIEGGERVREIKDRAFMGCASLEAINFPIVEKIEEYAFFGCSELKEIVFPLSLAEIGNEVFSLDSKVSKVYSYSQYPIVLNSNIFSDISTSATLYTPSSAIDRYKTASVWKDFPLITSFNVPIEELEVRQEYLSIDTGISQFLNYSVKPINFTSEIKWISKNNEILDVDARGKIVGKNFGETQMYIQAENLSDTINVVVIPGFDNLLFTPMGDNECMVEAKEKGSMFHPNKKLKNVKLPKYVYLNNEKLKITSMAERAFYYCALDTLIIDSDLKTLPTFCFQGASMDSISLPSSIAYIDLGAFNDTKINSNIKLSKNVTLGEMTFLLASLGSIDIEEGMTQLPNNTFTNAIIKNGVLELPNSIEIIGRAAISLDSVRTIRIGNKLQQINVAGGFRESIDTLICLTKTPPSLLNARTDCRYPILAVPGSSLEAYKHSYWGTFFKDIVPIYYDPTEIALNFKDLSLHIGEVANLKYVLSPEDVDPSLGITWESTNGEVASVDDNGRVEAISIGECNIIARIGTIEAVCHVEVSPILAEALTLTPDSWTGEEGSSFSISALILPENTTDKSILWESSDSDIATVDAEGLVHVLKTGECIISAYLLDGSNLTAECKILSTAGIEQLFEDNSQVDVFSLSGWVIKRGCSYDDLKTFGNGVFIIRLQDGSSVVYYNRGS